MADNHNVQHKAFLDDLLLVIPGVRASKAFGYPCYKVNGRIFCFIGSRGVSIKLPRRKVDELIAAGTARPMQVGDGTIWKDWVNLDHDDSDTYADDLPLFEESIGFVGGLG